MKKVYDIPFVLSIILEKYVRGALFKTHMEKRLWTSFPNSRSNRRDETFTIASRIASQAMNNL